MENPAGDVERLEIFSVPEARYAFEEDLDVAARDIVVQKVRPPPRGLECGAEHRLNQVLGCGGAEGGNVDDLSYCSQHASAFPPSCR
jgi:hypothetical protein